jgi:hypothetical protein
MKTRPVRMTAKKIHLALANLVNPDIAAHSMRFFENREWRIWRRKPISGHPGTGLKKENGI